MKYSYITNKEITTIDDQLNTLQEVFKDQNGGAIDIKLHTGGNLIISFTELNHILDLARKGLILEKLE